MGKKPTIASPQAKQESVATVTRTHEPEEFDADTDEERPIFILAERRRQFLSTLKARETQPDQ